MICRPGRKGGARSQCSIFTSFLSENAVVVSARSKGVRISRATSNVGLYGLLLFILCKR